MDLHSLVPQVLIEDKDYKIFLDIINQISIDIHGLISEIPNLVDIDNVPDIFLPKLSALVRYNLRTDLDINYQREIIKRLIEIYRARGSDDEIIMAATYGDYDYWVGSHIFYPEAEINRQKAELVTPVDELFRHSKSQFSGYDRYPGATVYREGTIVIKLSYVDDKIREAIKKVVPAGIKIYYYLATDTSDGTGFVVDYGVWEIENETVLAIELKDQSLTFKPAKRSDPTGARSSIYTFDGTRGYITAFFVDFRNIEPNHEDYPAEIVGNKFVGNSLDCEILDLEILIVKDA